MFDQPSPPHVQARDLGYDYIHRDKDPLPTGPFDGHGTAVAGIIAMSKDNGVCGVGVAYGSTITGVPWGHILANFVYTLCFTKWVALPLGGKI